MNELWVWGRTCQGAIFREDEVESAELQVAAVSDGIIQVSGVSLWGLSREAGPNFGEIDGQAKLRGSRAVLIEQGYANGEYRLELTFKGDTLLAVESRSISHFGMGVSFAGEYRRVG